uniref:Uncharacterized protein n=1 Tax=Panagrolaimus superbus TaxID=310955 RepID=A0A914YMR6_9BILA
MTSLEQFKVFAQILSAKEIKADVYLYQQGHRERLWKTNEHEVSKSLIPVIRLLDGRLSATSINNRFSFDLKNRILRTETQKVRREKRIAQCKAYHSKLFDALNHIK